MENTETANSNNLNVFVNLVNGQVTQLTNLVAAQTVNVQRNRNDIVGIMSNATSLSSTVATLSRTSALSTARITSLEGVSEIVSTNTQLLAQTANETISKTAFLQLQINDLFTTTSSLTAAKDTLNTEVIGVGSDSADSDTLAGTQCYQSLL